LYLSQRLSLSARNQLIPERIDTIMEVMKLIPAKEKIREFEREFQIQQEQF